MEIPSPSATFGIFSLAFRLKIGPSGVKTPLPARVAFGALAFWFPQSFHSRDASYFWPASPHLAGNISACYFAAIASPISFLTLFPLRVSSRLFFCA